LAKAGAFGQQIWPVWTQQILALPVSVSARGDRAAARKETVMSFQQWILANGDTLQVGLFFGLLIVLAAVEWILPRRLLNTIALPTAVAVTVTLLVRGFISFFTHYLMHMVPAFWRLHRVHHLDTELDVTTTVRFHPLEFAVQILPAVPIVMAFGLTPWVLALCETLDVVVTLWTHSNTRLPLVFDHVLRYVVVTPDLHRIHHSAWKPETNSNFGAVFPVWDLIFGTFRAQPRDGHERMRLGLEDVRGRDAQRPLWLLGSFLCGRL
jgi:sterol desaturase/sphingolipid hydroxylase (fatty acid hydroxylase superfamily)